MSRNHRLAIFLSLMLALQAAAAQTETATSDTQTSSSSRWALTIDLIADRGRDRFGNLTVQRGNWQAQIVNWASPGEKSALSALLVGREFNLFRWGDVTVLAGTWNSYEHHAWNEMVFAAHFAFHGERFRVACQNYWGSPLRSSGYFYETHTQTITGLPSLPTWLGMSFVEEQTSHGLVRLFLGPMLTRPVLKRKKGGITVSAFPYWDVQRASFDVRLKATFRHEVRKLNAE